MQFFHESVKKSWNPLLIGQVNAWEILAQRPTKKLLM